MRFIVNIFIELDKPLKEFDMYLKNIAFWEEWAKAHSYKHILITKENYKQFINECHIKFIDNLGWFLLFFLFNFFNRKFIIV